jgi:predicted homoserine dehydrogenase-like protein
LRESLLPLGLAHGVALTRNIAEGEQLRWDDVACDAGDAAVKLRREMEVEFGQMKVSEAL